jgi:hypothetical protein
MYQSASSFVAFVTFCSKNIKGFTEANKENEGCSNSPFSNPQPRISEIEVNAMERHFLRCFRHLLFK